MKKKRAKNNLFGLRYPHLFILLLTFIAAYIIFAGREYPALESTLFNLGYIGTFLSGILLAFGFTAGPAIAFFLILSQSQNIFFAAIIGGAGALFGDYTIFRMIRFSFKDEVLEMEKDIEKQKIVRRIEKNLSHKIKHAMILIFAELMIASPLPDEIGVSIISFDRKISHKAFIVLSFLIHSVGILALMLIGKAL